MNNELIKKYVKDMDGLLREINESDIIFAEQLNWGHNMLIFLFGRLFRYLNINFILIQHEIKGDLDAFALVDGQQVIIEFEVTSRMFDHDPEKCDLIVCWEHNWKKCPSNIDVLELKYFWEKAKQHERR